MYFTPVDGFGTVQSLDSSIKKGVVLKDDGHHYLSYKINACENMSQSDVSH